MTRRLPKNWLNSKHCWGKVDMSELSQSQRILLALKEAKLKIESYERAKSEPIAIIGMGCRFPGGADTPEKYWEFLRNGQSGIREIPKDRWDMEKLYDPNPDAPGKIYIRHGGFLDNTDQFDPAFFRISPREAESLDPQQRLLLEVSYEALCHAGIDPGQLIGSQTGVFVGVGQSDYSRFQLNCGDLSRINAYDGTGNLFCFVSGRLSYTLGLNGPNLTLDTACSSSLVAIHLACQSLRSRECDMALTGGVHLVFSPEITVFLCRTHVLSPDGLCRTFDSSANGFGRGEGCGMIVLKRLSDAISHNDNILAVIRGSAINHDGASSGLTVPNELAQEDLIRRALSNAKAEPSQIGYIEAHGTGTSLGDPIELGALASVFKEHPIVIGSVKTNFGHLEAAAGVAGLMKTVLMLQHREIPPHLHFNEPTPRFDWNRYPYQVPTKIISWESSRMAGVSSFGMSGTNAHIILEESPIADSLQRVQTQMPDYQRERYWVNTPQSLSRGDITSGENIHPLLGKRLSLPFSQEIRFDSRLRSDSPKFMDDHRIFGQVISPAASHVSTVLSAVKAAFGKESCVLEEIFFSRALVLPESSFRKVQLIVTPQNSEIFSFRLISCGEEDDETLENSWILHVSGKLRVFPLSSTSNTSCFSLLTSHSEKGSAFYANLDNAGYRLGTAFQWGKEFWQSESEALCKIGKPHLPDSADDYQLYPGLLDTCFQLLSSFWAIKASDLNGSNDLYVPFSISELKFYQRPDPNATLWCHAQRASDRQNAGHLRLFDDNGNVFAEVSGFEFRTANRQALFQSDDSEWKNWLYQRSWIPKPLPSEYSETPKNWLIFADNRGVGRELARQLRASGHDATLVFQDDSSDIRQLLEQRAWHGIVHLWHLNLDESRSYQPLFSALYLIQALARSAIKLKLWIVTQGVYAEMPENSFSCFQAPIWGLTRTLALEHPGISCVCADLPVSDENNVRHLLQEILTPDGEDQITWRNGIRHAARLEKFKPKSTLHFALCTLHCSYLITGGLGALGIRTARWLTDQGARYLVLTGRRAPSDQAKQQIADIEQVGTKVLILQADISDKSDAEMVFRKIHAEMPELLGIIHAAGVIDDAVLLRQDEARFKTVMKPKIDGTWNLHLLTRNMKLDFFVCFSSIASVLGSPGQGNYAAANAFMDALMRYRRASGLAGTSIQWGAWSETGMAAELNEQHQRRLMEQGMGVIAPNQGMAVLGQMLCENIAEVSVIPADWTKYLKHFPQMPLLSEFAVKESPPSSAIFARQLETLPTEKRAASISEFVRNQVATVLKLKSADKIKARERLFDAGMDSLMAVELRNRLSAELEKPLPATLVFDYPTIEALSDYLCREVLMIESEQSEIIQDSENITDVDMDSLLNNIAQKSDSDLLKELRGQAG